MSRKKSRPSNQPSTSSGPNTSGSGSTGAHLLPNRPKSTGLLRADDSSFDEIDEIDEIDEVDEVDEIDDGTARTEVEDDPADTPASQPADDPKSTHPKSNARPGSRPTASKQPRKPASANAVVADGVAKTYGDLPALAPLDLTVATGERVALIGHNGSGKTTFLKMVCGLLDPSDGSIEVFGNEPGSIEARRAVSYLSDQPVFYDDLSLIEHIEYVARLHGVDEWQAAGDDLLDRFRLGERSQDLPVTFSRGLKQKASICLAFIRPFDLLVVDEPFVGLDAVGRTELLELMSEHHQQGATLLVATHELTTVGASDRIVALRSGEVAYDGDTEVDVTALVDDAT